jgi:Flp pilus assembly protein protease CpaA
MIGLLLVASYTDLTRLLIPNAIVLAIAGLFLPFATGQLFEGQWQTHDVLMHFTAGLVVLVIGFVGFTVGLKFGGGDVKFLSVLALWCGFAGLPSFLLTMVIVNAAIAIIIFALRHFGIPAWFAAHGWEIQALCVDKSKSYVPFAPAMATAFIVVFFGAL